MTYGKKQLLETKSSKDYIKNQLLTILPLFKNINVSEFDQTTLTLTLNNEKFIRIY
jgi:hypothetical protein